MVNKGLHVVVAGYIFGMLYVHVNQSPYCQNSHMITIMLQMHWEKNISHTGSLYRNTQINLYLVKLKQNYFKECLNALMSVEFDVILEED